MRGRGDRTRPRARSARRRGARTCARATQVGHPGGGHRTAVDSLASRPGRLPAAGMGHVMVARAFGILALCILLHGCGRPAAPEAAWAGDWRIALQLPGGELPFGLELRAAAGTTQATVVNGEERIDIG